MPNHTRGTAVRYCHEGTERFAQVTSVHPDTGEVTGLAVYDEHLDERGEVTARTISHGVTDAKPATTQEHRSTHGHFWRR